ncbi:MAG TPA: hypothetical protein VJK53_03385, partial [Candidatus Paceibacterota bacterium]
HDALCKVPPNAYPVHARNCRTADDAGQPVKSRKPGKPWDAWRNRAACVRSKIRSLYSPRNELNPDVFAMYAAPVPFLDALTNPAFWKYFGFLKIRHSNVLQNV